MANLSESLHPELNEYWVRKKRAFKEYQTEFKEKTVKLP
jgi:hypothetical protein